MPATLATKEITINISGLIIPANTQSERFQLASRTLSTIRHQILTPDISGTLKESVKKVHSSITDTSKSIWDQLVGASSATLEFTDPVLGTKWIAGGSRLPTPTTGNLGGSYHQPAHFEVQKEESDSGNKKVTTVDVIIDNGFLCSFDVIGLHFQDPTTNHSNDYEAIDRAQALLREFRQALLHPAS